MSDDVLMFLVSSDIVMVLALDYLDQRQVLSQLQYQLDGAREQLAKMNNNTHHLASQYRKIMKSSLMHGI